MSIDLYFDLLSPYSYLAIKALRRYAWSESVILRPVSLPKIIEGTGNVPPGACPAKRKYMQTDLARLAVHYGCPFQFPGRFPFQTKLGNAAIAAATVNEQLEVAQLLYDEIYGRGSIEFLGGKESVEKIIGRPFDDKEGITIVRQNTEEALERGVFGVPTFAISRDDGSTELFFGEDRMFLISKL